jgi:hypothetical protein
VPRDLFTALGDKLLEQSVETEQSPESQGQPDVAEASHTLKAKVTELDQDRLVIGWFVVVRWVEQRGFWAGRSLPGERPTELRPATLLTAREFPKIGDDAVSRASGRSIRFDKGPIDVVLAVLPPSAALKEHDAIASLGSP